jgi:hypothetical protein
MASPRRANSTLSSIRAWVPIAIARLASADFCDRRLLVALLQAAGEPGHFDAQRFQPGGELAVMLLGEDFGRRHQRRLVAGLDRVQHGQRGDHGLAAADVALQQALHRMRLAEVGGDLAPGALLRAGQANGSDASSASVSFAVGASRRRAARAAGEVGAAQADLLRQQFVELHAAPGRVVARLERRLRHLGRRRVQEADGLGELGQAQARAQRIAAGCRRGRPRQRLLDQAAQRGLARPAVVG